MRESKTLFTALRQFAWRVLAFGVLAGAASGALSVEPATTPDAGKSPAPISTLSASALANMTYGGFADSAERMKLVNGRWHGKPPDADSSLSPTLNLMRQFVARGDLDGDGRNEAAVILNHWTGGSGEFVYLAVVANRDGKARNVATRLLGDRVQIRKLRIEKQSIVADLVVAGPNDPSCCPSMNQQRAWKLKGDMLEPTAPQEASR